MSKSLPIVIDTTAASMGTTIATASTKLSEAKRRPEAAIHLPSDASVEMEKGNDEKEKEGPPSSLQPHSNQAKVATATAKTASTQPNSDNNHRQHDETEAIASITRHQNDQKQHEYNNDYQITAKPLYDAAAAAAAIAMAKPLEVTQTAHQMNRMHDGIAEKAGKNDDDMENSVHGTLTTSRDAAKLSKTMSPSTAPKIRHTDIETMLTILCVLVLAVTLVICMIVSVRQRMKSNKYCDKTNLISSSASCSSTNSINDCEMDFNGSTTSIAQMTAIHV